MRGPLPRRPEPGPLRLSAAARGRTLPLPALRRRRLPAARRRTAPRERGARPRRPPRQDLPRRRAAERLRGGAPPTSRRARRGFATCTSRASVSARCHVAHRVPALPVTRTLLFCTPPSKHDRVPSPRVRPRRRRRRHQLLRGRGRLARARDEHAERGPRRGHLGGPRRRAVHGRIRVPQHERAAHERGRRGAAAGSDSPASRPSSRAARCRWPPTPSPTAASSRAPCSRSRRSCSWGRRARASGEDLLYGVVQTGALGAAAARSPTALGCWWRDSSWSVEIFAFFYLTRGSSPETSSRSLRWMCPTCRPRRRVIHGSAPSVILPQPLRRRRSRKHIRVTGRHSPHFIASLSRCVSHDLHVTRCKSVASSDPPS